MDELKLKLKSAEEIFERNLKEENESNALKLAQCKQEMHLEIEKKDQTIEELRQIIKTCEKNCNKN